MIIQHYKNLTQLWGALMKVPWSKVEHPVGGKIISYDNVLSAESCEFDMDLSTLGYTKGRWTSFLGSYVDRDTFITWVEQCKTDDGEVSLQLGVNSRHTRGPCVLAIVIRVRVKPEILIYSRTAVLPTRATLELSLASLIAKLFRESLGVELGFRWYSASIQWWGTQLSPYLNSIGRYKEYAEGDYPLSHEVNQTMIYDGNFSQVKRVRSRSETIQKGGMPPLPIKDLFFMWRTTPGARTRVDLAGNIYKPLDYPEGSNLILGNLRTWKTRAQ